MISIAAVTPWVAPFDPTDPDVVWVLNSGLYRSTDRGESWSFVGLPEAAVRERAREDGAVSEVEVARERLELLDVFDVIADAYTVRRNKPHPDLFIWVAGALGIMAHEAIASLSLTKSLIKYP